MPNNIHDVFRDLVEVDGANTTRDVPGVIAYGLFWADLEAWINHQVKNGGPHPSPADIDRHIQTNLTENYFRDLEGKALQLFGEAALEFLSDKIEAEKEAAVSSSILASIESYNQVTLAEIAKGSNLWRQTGTALITAIVAPLLLGAILVAIQAYSGYFTPKDAANNINGHADATK